MWGCQQDNRQMVELVARLSVDSDTSLLSRCWTRTQSNWPAEGMLVQQEGRGQNITVQSYSHHLHTLHHNIAYSTVVKVSCRIFQPLLTLVTLNLAGNWLLQYMRPRWTVCVLQVIIMTIACSLSHPSSKLSFLLQLQSAILALSLSHTHIQQFPFNPCTKDKVFTDKNVQTKKDLTTAEYPCWQAAHHCVLPTSPPPAVAGVFIWINP